MTQIAVKNIEQEKENSITLTLSNKDVIRFDKFGEGVYTSFIDSSLPKYFFAEFKRDVNKHNFNLEEIKRLWKIH